MTPAGHTKPRRTASAPEPRATPAMRQHARFKALHPGCVLFFRMGDFYEMFDDDALLAHRVLGITLTQRTAGVPMAGVPYHAVEGYLRRMIDAGHRVAICDQVQDASEATGIVDRAVTRVLTPGTLVDETLLDEGRPNHVAALLPGAEGQAATAIVELSTGSFGVNNLPAGRVVDEVVRAGTSELLYPETDDGTVPAIIEQVHRESGCALTPRPAWTFRAHDAKRCLCDHFGVTTLAGFGLDDDDPAIGPAGAVLHYLKETQSPDGEPGRGRLGHLGPPRRETPDAFVTIDAASLRNLEIERTIRDGRTAGSLAAVFGRLKTAAGRRLVRRWLCYPLRDIEAIEERHRAVGALIADDTFATSLRGELGEVQDVARISARVAMSRATPRDVVALGRSLARAGSIADLLQGRPAFAAHHGRLAEIGPALATLAGEIQTQCTDDPPAHLREGGLFRDGADTQLDEARTLARDATSWLTGYQKQLVNETGIGSLKVGFNKVFGYYIEITHKHADKVPPTLSRKQTLKNAERYITPELKSFEDRITTARAEGIEREKALFEALCLRLGAEAERLSRYGHIAAELDCLACFAEVARRRGWCRPEMVREPILDIRGGRHPVLDETLGERFVPNDCTLGGETGSLALITGPNMAGKSTAIRQVALIVLMAHAGSYVPAKQATIGATDRIFTRIGASDELHAGRSTFMVEMTETANILNHATDRSLVILDEIGRGTSTLDGLSLAWAIAEALAARRCRTLFATHYHELTALADRLEGVCNLHVTVREWGEEIIFLYRIVPGRSDRSYGIHVARIAGLPGETIRRASELLETLAVHSKTPDLAAAPQPATGQLGLFTEYIQHPTVETLRTMDLSAMTPLEAFDALRRLQSEAGADGVS